MRRACFARREEASRRREAHVPYSSQHGFKTEADMTCDVLEKQPLGVDLSDDPLDIGPEMPLVTLATTLAGGAERLAGIARKDRVDMPAPTIADEAAQVVPHRGRPERSGAPSACGGRSGSRRSGAMFGKTGQISTHHSSDKRGLGVGIELNKAAGVKTRLGKLQSEIEPAVSGAEAEAVSGPPGIYAHVMYSHLTPSAR
nr:hypothetical protein [Paracoccus alkanivorans]